MENLNEIRKKIDSIDKQLIHLFKQRMDCAKSVGFYKQKNNIPILNTEREKEILKKVEKKGGEYGSYTKILYSNILELSRSLQHNIIKADCKLRNSFSTAKTNINFDENVNIAVQGIKGANSNEAANIIFSQGNNIFYNSFADVFNAVENKEADYGILPVENSTAGSVSDVYDLILKHRFHIIHAHNLKIDHCLCGLPQATLEDIEQVWSHPQAIAQCSEYIEKNNLKSVPYHNTAFAAKEVQKEKRLNCAAICSKEAAKEYGLKILKRDFQNSKNNTTRFIVISKDLYIPNNADKISLCFSLPHVTGSLYSTLCRFSALGLSLTKIESRPIKNKDFEYLFYLDFSGNLKDKDVVNLICGLSGEMPEFSFLGNYYES